MLSQVLATAVATLLPLLIGAISVCALVAAVDSGLSLRWRNLHQGVANILFEGLRRRNDTGASVKQMRSECKRNALRMLLAPDGSRLTWIRPDSFHHALVAVMEVDPDDALAMRTAFANADAALRKRFTLDMRIWCLVWSALLSVTYLVLLPAAGYPPWETWSVSAAGVQSIHLGTSADVVLATILLTLGAQLCFRVFRQQLGDPSEHDPAPVRAAEPTGDDERVIGCDNCAIRAINFAGGGFSTIMQLGVTHALMTIQGRAPDAVVGVSAGAVQAAALAEVLQAGDEIESEFGDWAGLSEEKKVKLQSRRMEARVIRFREFLSEYQTVRERLFDSVLPDAYQVDSHEPLEPLQSPLYDRKERRARLSALEAESGLVRLYNDLLQLNIPVGVIVRVIRRVLGFQAAGNLKTWLRRNYMRGLECVKIWLLLGGVLWRASPVLGPLRRALLSGAARKVTPCTAESIIFQFNIAVNIRKAFEICANFLVVLVLWLGIGLAPAAIAAGLIKLSPWQWTDSYLEVVIVILGIYVVVPLLVSAAVHRSALAIGKTFRGLLQALWLVFKWTIVLYVLMAVSVMAVADISEAINTRSWAALGENAGFLWRRDLLLRIIRYIPLISAAVPVLFLLRALRLWIRKYRVLQGDAEPSTEPGIMGRLLASYRISASFFSSYPLKRFFAPLFDQDYFGKTDMDSTIASALVDSPTSSTKSPGDLKTVGHYSSDQRPRPIHVGLAVANVGTGTLEIVPPEQPVVDGLIAAFAVVPWFPPQVLGNNLYVDGANVANVPTRALLSMLRNRINPNSRGVHIYSVVPLPFSRTHLYSRDQQKLSLNLWDTAMRALFLQKFRDAVVERNLTELYTDIIPKKDKDDQPNFTISIGRGSKAREFFRGWVTPIELEEPISLNERVLTASKEERHKAVLETVADGCRASLETMIRVDAGGPIRCRYAVRHHLVQQSDQAKLTRKIIDMRLPGSGPDGPGLKEVCAHCALFREDKNRRRPQTLEMRALPEQRPSWPHERSAEDPDDSESSVVTSSPAKKPDCSAFELFPDWPLNGAGKPTVSMLFSGGVFRGVYQMGVLNALGLLDLRPDVVAGASVGSITAGMVTKVFSGEESARQSDIARLASIYLGIDRLILTDQFDSFVRNLTIRAAATKFSVSEADAVFRKYDFPSPAGYSRSARDVVAGIERLLYVNPYQLNALVSAVRNRESKSLFSLLRTLTQQWLDKMDVGEQVLGADALKVLIEHFVIPANSRNGFVPTSFNAYDEKLIHLLATTTNVTKGELAILGNIDSGGGDNSTLLEGLLASSAFPGVFRPRYSYDLQPGTADEQQFIDGGVMDNFPINAVVEFLLAAQACDRIGSGFEAPARPHLIFGASLETNARTYRYPDQWRGLRNNWPALLARTKELGYNAKLDTYELAEKHVREIYTKVFKAAADAGGSTSDESLGIEFTPLNIEVVTVKPEWLCGTFAFHPMLGFRRKSQAMSIAHGCASTLLRFKGVDSSFRKGWRINEKYIPVESGIGRAWENWREHRKSRGKSADGDCWLKPGIRCPFSRQSLMEMNANLARDNKPLVQAVDHLATIHKYCVDPSTHMRDGDSTGWVERYLRKHQIVP